MKWVIVGFIFLVVLALAVILPRKSVHAELVIDAKPASIWETLMDTSTYGEWNPIFTDVAGTFSKGATMRLNMTTADGGSTQIDVLVKEMLVNQALNQTAGIPGVLTADHRWLIEETAQGTRVVQHEEYRGLGVLFYDPTYAQDLYQQGLVSLKKRLEEEGSVGG